MSPLGGLLVALLCAQASVTYAKILKPCEVADVMYKLGQKKAIVAKWVCLAKFASGFNTQALSPAHKDGSYDFGIFQINDKYCRLGSTNSCGVPCTDLVQEDITQTARCAIKIFQKEGFKAWPAFGNNCQAIDTSRFIVKCSLKAEPLRKRVKVHHGTFDINFSDEEDDWDLILNDEEE